MGVNAVPQVVISFAYYAYELAVSLLSDLTRASWINRENNRNPLSYSLRGFFRRNWTFLNVRSGQAEKIRLGGRIGCSRKLWSQEKHVQRWRALRIGGVQEGDHPELPLLKSVTRRFSYWRLNSPLLYFLVVYNISAGTNYTPVILWLGVIVLWCTFPVMFHILIRRIQLAPLGKSNRNFRLSSRPK